MFFRRKNKYGTIRSSHKIILSVVNVYLLLLWNQSETSDSVEA